ncbi:MAG: PP2C family protein-serine/threonine phosphatase, partial [Bacteroidota bacterium]
VWYYIKSREKKLVARQKELEQKIEIATEDIKGQKHIIEEKHKEITDSINYAERIQKSFLATKLHLDNNLSEYFVLFKPKEVVSGDFYWSATLNNGLFALVTADSTGHGVPGAIMSLLNIGGIEKAIETYTSPADILNS